ncbi:hypothetical protein [Imtechella halotolerans]|uniref:Beta-carotene 15,15'-monooxygenase n=1 Tax=Imtechella halotolerans K1 TaxID=946077 RepID=I0W7C1_9FLAO|nr:hypothetical protein [Imtechella halotolerans]EID72287.1 hypothetical protein W5A_12306 [Imtechella halotolerans K1]WMQ64389.1 hypothetical protein PT603_05270 [Imtechella halotolerans]
MEETPQSYDPKNSYTASLTDILEYAFGIYKKTFGIITLVMLMVSILGVLFYFLLFPVIFGISLNDFFSLAGSNPESMELMLNNNKTFINSLLVGLLFATLLAPIQAGIMSICQKAGRGEIFGMGEVFSFYGSKYFGKIVSVTLLISLVSGLISWLLQMTGLNFLNFFFSAFINLFTVLSIPLIIFKEQNVNESITNSIIAVRQRFLITLGSVLIGTICAFIGIFLCGIGILFTIPFLYAVYYSVYHHIIDLEKQ